MSVSKQTIIFVLSDRLYLVLDIHCLTLLLLCLLNLCLSDVFNMVAKNRWTASSWRPQSCISDNFKWPWNTHLGIWIHVLCPLLFDSFHCGFPPVVFVVSSFCQRSRELCLAPESCLYHTPQNKTVVWTHF